MAIQTQTCLFIDWQPKTFIFIISQSPYKSTASNENLRDYKPKYV